LRLGRGTSPLDVWPALPLTECEAELLELSRAWQVYLANLSPDSLGQEIRYTNSKGENWGSTVADLLTHVALPSSYHRGHIAPLLGRAGETAAYSDYIECIRRG